MIFHELVSLYESLKKDDPDNLGNDNWVVKSAKYGIEIDSDGSIMGIMPLGEDNQNISILAPNEDRTSGDRPYFLLDTADYLFGLDIKNKENQTKKRRLLSHDYHLTILENAKGEASNAIKNFFIKYKNHDFSKHEEISAYKDDLTKSFAIFMYDGEFAVNDKEIRELWENYNKKKNPKIGFCLISGEIEELSDAQPTIKYVNNAQPTARLISFNEESFTSYGKKENENISRKAAAQYGAALNYLLRDKTRTNNIGNLTVTGWVNSGERVYSEILSEYLEKGYGNTLEDAKEQDRNLRKALQNLSKGKSIDWDGKDIEPNHTFNILGLAGNNGRIAVNFFLQNDFGKIAKNIATHEERLKIIRPDYAKSRYLTLNLLIDALKPKDEQGKIIDDSSTQNIYEELKQNLFKAIVLGVKYPKSLFYYALDRYIKDSHKKITKIETKKESKSKSSYSASLYDEWILIAILKAYIQKNINNKLQEVCTVELNEQTEIQPYLLGRMLAVVERFQEASESGEINSTIKDQYLQSFCINPCRVFSRICFAKEVYENKLRKQKPALAIYYDKLFGEITKKIKYPIAKRQSMEEQAAFLLGYYHQTQKLWEKRDQNKNDMKDDTEEEE